ncbi:MAG: ATP-binding protein, partial [Lachnospiraceae bacterium]
MRKWKNHQIIIFITICIVVNFLGKLIAEKAGLPLWLDSVGTVMVAYVFGPVAGAVAGGAVNLAYGAFVSNSYIYAFTNIAVGITVGLCAKKGWLNKALSAFSVSMLVALVATNISVWFNCIFSEGMTGNIWGDSVIKYLEEFGLPKVVCYVAGEFYLDLADKIVAVYVTFFAIKFHRNKGIKLLKKFKMIGTAAVAAAIMISSVKPYCTYAYDVQLRDARDDNFNSYVQTVYNRSNGIPSGEVNAIAQTMDGMLWIGTYGGLYQYDGTSFSFISRFEPVRSVNCLYTDEEGRLWIGTNDNGVAICANNQLVNVLNQDGGLPSDSIRSIVKSTTGNYYIGTTDSFCIVVLSDGIKVVSVMDELKYVKRQTAGQDGYICAVTHSGSIALINGTSILQTRPESNDGSVYTSAYFDENGILYASTAKSNIEKYEIKNNKLELIETYNCSELVAINDIRLFNEHSIIVCADNGIGYIDSSGKFNIINTGSFDSSIDNILVDYQENIWFSSSRLGLLKISESIFEEVYMGVGLDEAVVNAVTSWKGQYYFGTDGGLDIVDGELEKIIHNDLTALFKNVRIRCLTVDSDNHLWVATTGKGVYEIYPDGRLVNYGTDDGLIADKTRVVYEMQDKTMVVASDGGISFIEDGRVVSNISGDSRLATARTLCVCESGGYLYAGTDGSGVAIVKDGKVTDVVRKKDGLSSDVILRIVEATDGSGLFVITGSGMCFMEPDGSVRRLNNFPYYNNFDVIADNAGNMWITGSAGIYKCREQELKSGEAMDYELLDTKKGLRQSFTANSWNYMDDNGNLFLCGDTGVVLINTKDYDKLRSSYRITLDGFAVDEVLMSVNKEDVNSIKRDAVKVEFFPKVINFSVNDPYVSIWLEGFEEEPRIMPQSELKSFIYTNLPSGDYKFHLAILDNRQENIIEEVSYSFTKEKEFYDNWWFRFYLFSIFAVIIVYLVWLIAGSQINKTLQIQSKELENLKLKQTADAAVAAGEAKDKFLALMSHDIRTPINAIIGMNEMIMRETNEQEVYDYAQDIKGASNTLLALVNSILDFSKIEEGKMEIIPSQYETRSLINNLINGVATRARDKGLDFRVTIDENIPCELYGDDVRIVQVISNLLTNAVKYTEEGFVNLIIREFERKNDIITLYIEVEDSGIGIRQEDMNRLFESFQRLDEQRNRNIEGTGLGMSIVTSLLEMMGSKLDVSSEYGVGSTFSFFLEQKIISADPIGEISAEHKDINEKKEEVHLQAPQARILVVDDNDINLKVASMLLKVNGIKPTMVTSGFKALEMVKKNRYDIIFLDHM